MPMKSKDVIQQELKDSLVQAFKSSDEDAVAKAFTAFAESVQQNVLEDAKTYQHTADAEILAKRGMHQLTVPEQKFYQGVIDAMKSENPQQAFTGLDVALPQTVMDNVMDDIKTNHPLLSAINFVNTTTLTKILVNKQGVQLAVWGPLNSAITQELSGAVGKIDLTLCKLSAYMPISKDMLGVGPEWMDSYVRAVLSEAIALAEETGIVDGTGKDQPIGMDRSVADGVTVTGGVYPKKTAVAITDFGVKTFSNILGTLSQAPNGKTRAINTVLLVVNPTDYFTKVFPATTIRASDGTFAHNVFPYPTNLIQSAAVPSGNAIFGIADRYFMGIGAGTNGGKIEYSDDFKFLDDERVYLTKLYGNGRALDDNAFVLADISGVIPAILEVTVSQVKGTVNTKAAT